MSRTITLSVRASGETEAPTVDDLLAQVRDYFDILEGVEQAIADDGGIALEWRITKAQTNSPIQFEAQAYSKDFGVNVDQRAEMVTRQTALGMRQLQERGERPPYFTDKVLAKVERLFERVTNGLEATTVNYGVDLPELDLTPRTARIAAANTRSVLKPEAKPYDEIGSIEGFVQSIARDGYGRHVVWVHHRLTGESIKCLVSGDALQELERHQIRDVWRGRRVQVHGKLSYKGIGNLTLVNAVSVRFLRDRTELPDVDDILDENFTSGLSTDDYLARLRDGKPS